MSSKSNLNKKKIISLSTVLILIGGGVFWRIGSTQNQTRNINTFTTYAESGRLPGLITATGELQSEKTLNLIPKRKGVIEKIYVEEGDLVKDGQLIAKMEDGDLIYRLNELKAEYEKQKADYKRREFLYLEGAISKENYEEYKSLFLKSQARLNQREVEKNDLEIRAPFKGLITSKNAFPGSFITPTTNSSSKNGTSNVNSIVELSQGLEVIAKVPESDIGRIKIGQTALIRVDSFPEERFKCKVEKISSRAIKNNNVTSFEVKLSLINSIQKLRIGMTADIEFQTGATAISTLVPTVAIVTQKGIPGLLLVGKDNQPSFKKIELGISSGDKTAIIKGIKPGDQIFIDLPPWAKESKD